MYHSKYEILDMLEVKQKKCTPSTFDNQSFYIAAMELFKFHSSMTISPLEYQISNLMVDNNNSVDAIIENMKIQAKANKTNYQRYIDNSRITSITNYLTKYNSIPNEAFGHLIPNSIILALDATVIEASHEENYEPDFSKDSIFIDKKNCKLIIDPKFLHSNDTRYHLSKSKDLFEHRQIDETQRFLIIDGNHRVQGIYNYILESNNFDFQVPVSIIVNCQNQDAAELFKTINYEVKPVNKSYYYQIVGEFQIGNEAHVHLHRLISSMNSLSSSPFYYRCKMLGGKITNEHGIVQTFSQSFFIEQCYSWMFEPKKRISIPSSFRAYRMPVLKYILDKNTDLSVKILVRFFDDIRDLYEQLYGEDTWSMAVDNPTKFNELFKKKFSDLYIENDDFTIRTNYLLKNIGLGALIRLFPYFYMRLVYDLGMLNSQEEIDADAVTFKKYLVPLFTEEYNILYVIESENTSGGGEGILGYFADKFLNQCVQNCEPEDVDIEYNKYVTAEEKYHQWYIGNMVSD